MFDQLAAEYGLPSPVVTPELVEELNEDIRSSTALSDLGRKIEWRDEAITELRALKQIKEVNKP